MVYDISYVNGVAACAHEAPTLEWTLLNRDSPHLGSLASPEFSRHSAGRRPGIANALRLLERIHLARKDVQTGRRVDAFCERPVVVCRPVATRFLLDILFAACDNSKPVRPIALPRTAHVPPKEQKEVKEITRSLLKTLKEAKLVLDWRKKLRTRADVYATVKTVLDELPRTYTPELFQEKCDLVCRHVFDSYQGEGKSVCESAS